MTAIPAHIHRPLQVPRSTVVAPARETPTSEPQESVTFSPQARLAMDEQKDGSGLPAPGVDPSSKALYENFEYFDTAAKGGKPDGIVSRGDLEAVANDPDADPALRAAAQNILDSQFDDLDSTKNGKQDGKISQDDVGLSLAWDAAQTINPHFGNVAQRDGSSGISLADLQAVLNDEHADPALREAAEWLVENPTYFEQLHVGGLSTHGPVG